jgi:hypothetical protein
MFAVDLYRLPALIRDLNDSLTGPLACPDIAKKLDALATSVMSRNNGRYDISMIRQMLGSPPPCDNLLDVYNYYYESQVD